MGASRREVANEPPSAMGGFASRPMVARLVRYGPVRQKKTFLLCNETPRSEVESYLGFLSFLSFFECFPWAGSWFRAGERGVFAVPLTAGKFSGIKGLNDGS